jgi:molybdate transport system substrate-binding protein
MKKNQLKNSKLPLFVIFSVCCFIVSGALSKASAGEIQAAVASNFYSPFKKIVRQFEKETGHKVQIISGSTGKLFAQIMNGAPFEVFLAADQRRPELLEKNGNAISGTRYTYALGKITLWSTNSSAISEDGESTLRTKNFSHIAIANPKTAPYGKAALQTMQKLGLWNEIRPLIVQGENIGQTFQFVASQNAELGFVALSQILDPKNKFEGKRWDVPETFYDPLKQDIVILKKGKSNPDAKVLWEYLQSNAAKLIIKKYGYGLP